VKKKVYEYKLPLGHGADGKSPRKSFYSTKSKADAKKKALKWQKEATIEEFEAGCFVATSPLFSDWGIRCIETYKKPLVKPITYTGTYYDPLHNHLIPYFGTRRLDTIHQIDVQKYVTAACDKYAVSTVKKDVVVLDLIFRMAIKNNMCLRNPVDEIHYPTNDSKNQKHAFNQEQYDTAYELAKSWPNGEALMLMLETGVSRSELLGLKWDDLDSESHYIYVNQGLTTYKDTDEKRNKISTDGLKNRYRNRIIPIMDDYLWERLNAMERTASFKGEDVQTEYVFHTRKGTPWNPNTWASRVFRPFMDALCATHPGYPKLSPHELRHSRATLWIAQGIDPYMVARLLGHSDTKMLTQVYDHTQPETLKNALLKIQNTVSA